MPPRPSPAGRLVALCLAAAPVAARAEPLPPAVREAVLAVSGVRAAAEEAYLAGRTALGVDLDGDGRLDQVVRVLESGEGRGRRCTNLVLRAGDQGLTQAGELDCCDPTVKPTLLGHRNQIRCGGKVVFAAGPRWPAFTPWTTRAQVTEAIARGQQLAKEGKQGEARWLLCKKTRMRGPQPPELRLACGWAQLGAGDPKAALFAFEDAMRLDPDGPAVWPGLAAAYRARGDAIAEAASLQKYLALRPDAPDRAAVEARLRELEPRAPAGRAP